MGKNNGGILMKARSLNTLRKMKENIIDYYVAPNLYDYQTVVITTTDGEHIQVGSKMNSPQKVEYKLKELGLRR